MPCSSSSSLVRYWPGRLGRSRQEGVGWGSGQCFQELAVAVGRTLFLSRVRDRQLVGRRQLLGGSHWNLGLEVQHAEGNRAESNEHLSTKVVQMNVVEGRADEKVDEEVKRDEREVEGSR